MAKSKGRKQLKDDPKANNAVNKNFSSAVRNVQGKQDLQKKMAEKIQQKKKDKDKDK